MALLQFLINIHTLSILQTISQFIFVRYFQFSVFFLNLDPVRYHAVMESRKKLMGSYFGKNSLKKALSFKMERLPSIKLERFPSLKLDRFPSFKKK